MRSFSRHTLCLLTASALLVACGNRGADGPQENVQAGDATEMQTLQQRADAAWAELSSSGARQDRLESEESLAYFMRQVEMSDIRRRELGLAFWSGYPNDPRRYEWLLLTVNMPPHYAVDIHDWAANETEVSPNKAAIDTKAMVAWDARYRAMRDAFWNAPEVSEQDRRHLWFGEIKQKILRLREAHVRGEMVDTESVLDEVLMFATAYPKSEGEFDQSDYWSIFGALSDLTFRIDVQEDEYGPAFAWTQESALAYWSRMMATENEGFRNFNEVLGDYLKQNTDLPTVQPLLNDSGIERRWRSLPKARQGPTSTVAGRIVQAREVEVARRKFRAIGAKFWRRYPNHAWRAQWLRMSNWQVPGYYKDLIYGIRHSTMDSSSAANIDFQARAEWASEYKSLRAEIWDSPATSEEDRSSIRSKEVWAELWDVRREFTSRDDMSRVESLLDHIHELWTSYQDSDAVWLYSGRVLGDYKSFGLDDDDLLAFFEPMLAYDNQKLQALAEAAFNTIELKRTPFEFTAETLHGESFDMKDLRGKIVLVDHWSTGCSSCISAMPRLDEIYRRYQDRGFEVVSIAYDATTKRKKVLRIENELGLTWTTVNGEGQRWTIASKYGYQGFPQYMLLNRDGTIYAGTAEVDMGRNLRTLLDEMLTAEAAERVAAIIH